MVSIDTVRESNDRIPSTLQKGLVALFIGGTAGIGKSSLLEFAKKAPSPRIYSVAREKSVADHEAFLSELREANPSGTYTLIKADVSLVSEVDKVAQQIKEKETKLDILFLTVGFIAWDGRVDTKEGLEPSMSTRYYSRARAIQQLLPLLNSPEAKSPRVIWIVAGGQEATINEDDLSLKEPGNWAYWPASVHAVTMGTLVLERFAREYPKISFVHTYPGPVDTLAYHEFKKAMSKTGAPSPSGSPMPEVQSFEEGGERGLFYATSDRYAKSAGFVPSPEGVEELKWTGGGALLVGAEGENVGDEKLLKDFRDRGVTEKIWNHTLEIFGQATGKAEV